MSSDGYAIIGAGPTGLAAARALDRAGLPWTGYEVGADVGGLWDIDGPRSTMYESAHLISSKTTTQFSEFPMGDEVADYPSHRALLAYFRSYAEHFGLHQGYRFGAEVIDLEPLAGGREGWRVTVREGDRESVTLHRGVVVANGTLSEPNLPDLPGHFDGLLLHTSDYRDPRIFTGKRVLVIGAGNSGCDIAVDAVHHADSVDLSVRRGYHFVPKYVLGRPADTLNQGKPLPRRIKQVLDSRLLRLFTGDPTRFGFPEPDHRLYESHPIVNSLVLHHLGHRDIRMRRDVERLDGDGVAFRDGERGEYDVVVLATGYRLHYPFIAPNLLGWKGAGHGDSPDLYLNIIPREVDGLFVLGMVEASGLGWQGRAEQAELVASLLRAEDERPAEAAAYRERARTARPDLSGGYPYLRLERMSYYVNKDAYRAAVRSDIAELSEDAS